MPNALINEKSPYLQQHAHNPVEWLPWGEAAFEKARAEDKPIFLSIGYSTCHWCHVMEHESFENEFTARLMNEHFVNVKVDREERPDVDRLYMTFVQATTGSGGWPLSIFLTPDLKPFFGGTYFPPRDAYGRISFSSLLLRINEAWEGDREKVLESSESVINALSRYATLAEPGKEEVDWARASDRCAVHYKSSYDSRYSGFGDAPKFPHPVTHDFLHRYYHHTGDAEALEISKRTLIAMGDGGMNDQLGGGFHRYSVDEQWIVSHFEKMLYDQAQLVISFLEMYQITRDPYFADIAAKTLWYVKRDMTHPDGGFYAAEDADSYGHEGDAHKEEGAFYVWTKDEIEEIIGAGHEIITGHFGVRAEGNAPDQGDPHGEFRGKNILYRAAPLAAVAKELGASPDQAADILDSGSRKLFDEREKRPRPHRDEKIIVAWNGLMISAFARAAQVLDAPEFLRAAQEAAVFINRELYDPETSTLRRHFRDGAADVPAFADDYAFLIRGLLDLYETTFETDYLKWALSLQRRMHEDFWHEEGGSNYSSRPDPQVLLRFKEDYDGAEPSPNSIAAENELRLWHLLGDENAHKKAKRIFEAFGARLGVVATAMPFLLGARLGFDSPPLHIVIVGDKESEDTRQLLRVVHETFLPHKSLLLLDGGAGQELLQENNPFLREMKQQGGRATAYVCRDFACRQPTSDPDELRRQLSDGQGKEQ